jgi:hypothetical protein
VHDLAAALRQRAHLLQWCALTLLRSDEPGVVDGLLAALWATPAGG